MMATGGLDRDDPVIQQEARDAVPEIARMDSDFDNIHTGCASFHQYYIEETRIVRCWARAASFLSKLYAPEAHSQRISDWAILAAHSLESNAALLDPVLRKLVQLGKLSAPTRSVLRQRWLKLDELLDARDRQSGRSDRTVAKWYVLGRHYLNRWS